MSGETVVPIVGNLTSDPELRYTQTGRAVANFTIASTPRIFDRTANEWRDGETLFLRCSVWGEQGEHCAASLYKGTAVIALGRLGQSSYEVEGVKRVSYQLDIEHIGPRLQYATAVVTKASKPSYTQPGPDETWATAAAALATVPA